jgi:DNA (cytosine-5)-methyltransferase 1
MKYFSTFTGIGGLDIGLEEIGAECVGFSEIKKSSIEVYKHHYPDHKSFGDITQINYKEIPDFDILTGGFPCQAFSLAGLRKGFGDKRGQMILYLYELLMEKKPQYFALENVKGLLNHNGGKTYKDVLKLLKSAGYNVAVLQLNAVHYGTAQNRERLVFIGNRDKFEILPTWAEDDSKVFRDIKDTDEKNYKLIPDSERNQEKLNQERTFNFEIIGGYDRVGTLTTQYGCGEKAVAWGDEMRYLTPLECERLQGFPEGWTDTIGSSGRYWALGNAVCCNVSRYLFKDYLPLIWDKYGKVQ